LQTVGYKELFDAINEKTTLSSAIEQIKNNTRHYAKRQLTWFKKDADIAWFNPFALEEIVAYLKEKNLEPGL